MYEVARNLLAPLWPAPATSRHHWQLRSQLPTNVRGGEESFSAFVTSTNFSVWHGTESFSAFVTSTSYSAQIAITFPIVKKCSRWRVIFVGERTKLAKPALLPFLTKHLITIDTTFIQITFDWQYLELNVSEFSLCLGNEERNTTMFVSFLRWWLHEGIIY